MNADFQKIFRMALIALAAAGVLALAVITIQSFARLFEPPRNSSAADAVAENAPPPEPPEPSPEAAQESAAVPFPAPAELSRPRPKPAGQSDFQTDFRMIQEREKGRAETIENMRQNIRSENGDTNAVMKQEKALRQMEESGASFL